MGRDVFSVIPYGIGVEVSFSLGHYVLGWRQCRTSEDRLQKKVIVQQFSWSHSGILADTNIGLVNDTAAAQNEPKEEDKKLLKLAGISDHIHFRRGRKERKKAKQRFTMKESAFAYISDTEEMSGSGWEGFKDCGTVAFHDKNGPPRMKNQKIP